MIHPQLQQLINLVFLLVLAKYVAHIYLPWEHIVGILLFTVAAEHTVLYLKHRTLSFFSYSALSTAIGVMLMMVSTHIYIYAILIGLALAQKHFLTLHGRHIFNPSNFALIAGLFLFYDNAHIVLGQLGDTLWVKIIVMMLAVFMLIRVQRWVIPLGFIGSYLLAQYFFVVLYDPVLIFEEVVNRLYSVAFIVFIVFMLTDPKTTPQKHWEQALFAFLLSLLATLLDRVYGFRVQHLFMALFLLSAFVPLFTNYEEIKVCKKYLLWHVVLIVLTLNVIIFIEIKPPYYFEMDG